MIDNGRRVKRVPGLDARAFALSLVFVSALTCLPGCSGGGGGGSDASPTGGGPTDLVVAGDDLDASGPVGGPFFPPASYILYNQGTDVPLEFQITPSNNGIRVSTPTGTIDPGGQIAVTVDVNPAVANTLLPGTYNGTVTFLDRAKPDDEVVRPATLTVDPVSTTSPILTEVVPPSGPPAGGNSVLLIGLNFEGGGSNTVTFGGRRATNVVVVSDARISCTVPAGSQGTTVDVMISNANGTYTLTRAYAYDSVLAVSNVEPERGPSAGGNEVAVVGTGFLDDGAGPAAVTFGGSAATNVSVQSDRSLTCTVPPGTPETWVDVVVSNNHGTVTLSNGYRYRDLPTLTSVTPDSGPASGGNSVTLSGSRFEFGEPGPNTVLFGGAAAANVVVADDSTLTCDAPFGTEGTTVDVIVSNINGTATLANGYSYHPEPTLTSVSPANGPADGGNTVTLVGAGFLDNEAGTNTVRFGGALATNVSVSSDTAVICDVPLGQGGTTVDVLVANNNGTASIQDAYTYDQVSGSLEPSTNFTASGPEGGPFTPDSKVYTITNNGSTTLRWSVAVSDPFVFVEGATNGSIQAGQATTVRLRIGSVADQFTPGTYTATVSFTDLDLAQVVSTRDVVLTVTSTVDGWTDITPSADTRMIYVSNSGSDSNDGFSPATPKRTIAAGRALLRDGRPDWLLLARGSTWTERIDSSWGIGGRSAQERMVIQDYGNPGLPRPTITGVPEGIGFSAGAEHVALVGVRFVNLTGDNAVDGHAQIDDLLIENCYFDGSNLSFQTAGSNSNPPRNVAIRRCVIANCGEDGLFTNEAQYFLIEDCLFYNNGLDDEIRKHNIYMSGNNGPDRGSGNGHDSTNNTVRGCLILKAGGNAAIKWRAQFNGTIERNLLSRNRITVGIHTKWPNEYSINNIFRENVIVDQGNPDATTNIRGLGINGAWDVEVTDNVIARNPRTLGGGNHAIALQMPQYDENTSYAGQFFPSSRNVLIQDNVVYGWNGNNMAFARSINMPRNDYANIQIIGNHFQNISPDTGLVKRLVNFSEPARFGSSGVTFSGNRYWSSWASDEWFRDHDGSNSINLTYSQWLGVSSESGSTNNRIPYSDPDRDLATYAASLGIGSTFDDFVNAAMQQEKGNWDPRLEAFAAINYVRGGFDLAPLVSP